MESGLPSSVDLATRRRDSILAGAETDTAAQPETASPKSSEPEDALADQPSTSPSPDASASQSRSQKIASELLADRTNSWASRHQESSSPSTAPAIARLMQALSKGGGASTSPIHVTLSERKCGEVTVVIVSNSGHH